MRPIYLQIKKAELVLAKKGRRNRTDWHLIETMQYEDTLRLFTSLGGEPIETDLQFIQAIYEEYGSGIYNLVAGKKKRRGFWSFLLFVIFEDGSCKRFFRRNAFDKRRRQRRNNIIAELREIQSNIPITDAAEIEKQIDDEFENEAFDQMGNALFVNGKRYGCYPYLRSTLRVEKLENLKPKQQNEIQDFWGHGNNSEKVEEVDEEVEEFPPLEKQNFWSHGNEEE